MGEELYIERAKKGEVEAFSDLVRLYQSRVRAYLSRFIFDKSSVDDVAQETFLAAFRSLANYDHRWPFRKWLLGIARNQIHIYLRERIRIIPKEESISILISLWNLERAEKETMEEGDLEIEVLKACLEKLPRKSSLLVKSFYFDQKGAGDIGLETGKSDNAVRLILLRIRKKLRKCIETQMMEG
jgi:RNA polymerase sigma-70 factor (ECF subfamily)